MNRILMSILLLGVMGCAPKRTILKVAWQQQGQVEYWDIWSRGTSPKTMWRLLATVKDTSRFIARFDSGEHRIDITAWLKGIESKSSNQVRFVIPEPGDVEVRVVRIERIP